MANIKSAKKRARQEVKRHAVNVARRSSLKTAIKKVNDALASNAENVKELLREAEAKLARAKGKGLIHGNTARRKVSRLAKKVAKAAQA